MSGEKKGTCGCLRILKILHSSIANRGMQRFAPGDAAPRDLTQRSKKSTEFGQSNFDEARLSCLTRRSPLAKRRFPSCSFSLGRATRSRLFSTA